MPLRSAKVPEKTIVTETVFQIIESEVKIPYIRPSQVDICEFAKRMDFLRLSVAGIRARLPAQMERNDRIRHALATLKTDLPILIDERKSLLRRARESQAKMTGAPNFVTFAQSEIEVLNGFLRATKQFSTSNIAIDLTDLGSMLDWHRIALQIAVQFRFLLECSNGNRRIGNAGPVPRFVSAMLIHVSGDKVEPETVKAMLKAAMKLGVSEFTAKYPGSARSRKIPG